jgi:hypothetical protein
VSSPLHISLSCYSSEISCFCVKIRHRTIQILVILIGDVVQPVPSTCKLYGEIIQLDALAINAFYFHIFTLYIISIVTDRDKWRALVNSVMNLLVP